MPTMEYTSKEILNKPSSYPTKIKRSIKKILGNISVEPTVFLTMFASIMYQLVVQNLYLEKACRVEIRFNESVCDAMTKRDNSGYTISQETEVQKLVSQMLSLRTFIQGTFPLIVVIFAGSWSDRHNSRKPLILLPIFGEIICCSLLIMNTVFFYELPLIFSVLGDSIPFALLGGWACFNSGMFSLIGAKYKNEEKTMRIGIITATLMSGLLLGSSCSGIIYQLIGFTPLFSLCIVLFSIAFLIGYFRIHEADAEMNRQEKCDKFKDIFSVKNVVETFKTCFKAGPNKKRLKMIAMILSLILVTGPKFGEISLYYLYTRLKFSWDSTQFALFASIQLIIQVFGAIIAVVLFSKILHWEDTVLGIVSIVGSITSNIIFALAPTPLFVFIACCCDVFLMSATIALRSLMVKIVPNHELGQANAMLALAETTAPMLFGPLYTTVYKYTLEVFPGAFFLVSALMSSLCFCFFVWLYKQSLQDRRRSRYEERNDTDKTHPESQELVLG